MSSRLSGLWSFGHLFLGHLAAFYDRRIGPAYRSVDYGPTFDEASDTPAALRGESKR